MYTQGLDQSPPERTAPAALPAGRLEQRFQARVDAEEKIEPKDWMPDGYRQTLIRQIPARALRDRRHAAGRQLDLTRALAAAQVHPDREGARMKAGTAPTSTAPPRRSACRARS